MRVHHLNCGTLCTAAPAWLRGGRWLVCHCLLIEAEDGLVMVESGLSTADVHDASRRLGRSFLTWVRPVLDERETMLRQVEQLGFTAADVRHVVLTHLDLDHAGGITDFPRAKIHVMAQEHEAATLRRGLRERWRYRKAHLAHQPDFELYRTQGERWNGFEAVTALRGLPPEILLVPLFGHTRGHAGVALRSDQGWLLHAGDAYIHHREMEGGHAPRLIGLFEGANGMDREACLRNRDRLAALARAGEVRVFCAHDAEELKRLQAG